jgi:hypothetical protein
MHPRIYEFPLTIADSSELHVVLRVTLSPVHGIEQPMSALCRISSPLHDIHPASEGALRFPCLNHSLLQARGRGHSKALFVISYHRCPRSGCLLVVGQKQLRVAFFQSFEQEFEPDASDIRRMGKNVKDEINLAKAQTDRQDQMLEEKEREAASKQRSRLRKFIPKVESELDTIKKLQMQRSTRGSSQDFLSR